MHDDNVDNLQIKQPMGVPFNMMDDNVDNVCRPEPVNPAAKYLDKSDPSYNPFMNPDEWDKRKLEQAKLDILTSVTYVDDDEGGEDKMEKNY